MAASSAGQGGEQPAVTLREDPGGTTEGRNPLEPTEITSEGGATVTRHPGSGDAGESGHAPAGGHGFEENQERGGAESRGFNETGGASLDDDGSGSQGSEQPMEAVGGDDALAADTTSSKERSAPPITLELLSKGGYYDMPMAKAAFLLGRTEGSFQRVCRGLGILRWPYRVRKSLQAIMAKTEEYLDDGTQEDGMSKAEVLKVLQARMDDIKGISGTGMDKATKQYRQYIFKLNHKLARRAAKKGEDVSETSAGPLKAKGILRAASKIQKQPKGESSHSEEPGSEPSASHQASGVAPPALARPTPRHFRDLPGGLALQQLGPSGESSVATTSAPQGGARSATVAQYQKACLQDDQELLRLCAEMDEHLRAAQEALMLRGPFFPTQMPPLLASSLYLQQVMSLAGAPALPIPGLTPPPMPWQPPPQSSRPGANSFWPVR